MIEYFPILILFTITFVSGYFGSKDDNVNLQILSFLFFIVTMFYTFIHLPTILDEKKYNNCVKSYATYVQVANISEIDEICSTLNKKII